MEDNKRILIIDELHSVLVEKFSSAGYECDYFPKINKKEIQTIIKNYIGVILRSKVAFDKSLIDFASNLKIIGRAGSGIENIDLKYAKTKGIKVYNSPEGNSDSVAEHTLGLLLSLLNRILISNIQIRNGIWKRQENWGTEIKGKTIGIIGYGNMGKAFAKRLKGFDANVIAYDKYKINFSDEYALEQSMDFLYNNCDIISFHIPYNEETKYLINDDYINSFKKPIILINTSRGKIARTRDLVKNLEEKKLVGVLLDVIEYENSDFERIGCVNLPVDFEALMKFENVIITPHVAGWSNEAFYKISSILADKIISDSGSL